MFILGRLEMEGGIKGFLGYSIMFLDLGKGFVNLFTG